MYVRACRAGLSTSSSTASRSGVTKRDRQAATIVPREFPSLAGRQGKALSKEKTSVSVSMFP
jgi:hypothetical protein